MLNTAYPKPVTLKDGRTVVLRPLAKGDFEKLYAFFQAVPDEDRLFLRDDICDPDLVRKWTDEINFAPFLTTGYTDILPIGPRKFLCVFDCTPPQPWKAHAAHWVGVLDVEVERTPRAQ